MEKLKLDIQRFAPDPPVAGKLIDEECLYEYHQNIETNYATKSSLAAVATTGDYDDLTNKPTIPSLSGLMYMEEITLVSGATINANANYGSGTITKTITPKSGYTPVLVVSSNTYDRRCVLWYVRIDTDTTIRWRAGNVSSNQLTGISIVVQVLYVKTSAFLGRNPS